MPEDKILALWDDYFKNTTPEELKKDWQVIEDQRLKEEFLEQPEKKEAESQEEMWEEIEKDFAAYEYRSAIQRLKSKFTIQRK